MGRGSTGGEPRPRRGRTRRALTALAVAATVGAVAAAPARAGTVSQNQRFTVSDGVSLQATVSGEAPLQARPTIVEFSPYGRGTTTSAPVPGFNSLLVQIRGTGDSDGRFDALGPRTQRDVAEALQWACQQPWSDGRLGINGFSASAITIYNSLHLPLPCVKAAVLKSGTLELYRDLLVPGGINNLIPGAGVLAMIGAPALIQGPERLLRNPLSTVDTILGLAESGFGEILRPDLDGWWRERGFRGDVNHLPILMINGFFDVESRGAFQAYQALRDDGAHLVVAGAHDGVPKGSDGGAGDARKWFEHYVAGADNGIEDEPRVKLWMADGDREKLLDGRAVRTDASDWPVPGTSWASLALDAAPAGGGHSSNDGSLTTGPRKQEGRQSFVALPSLFTASDPPNAGIVGAAGVNDLTRHLPFLTDMTLAEGFGLSYTTRPLREPVLSAGPGTLELRLSSSMPTTGIWVVVSDVGPDGKAHPVASGRLNSDFPEIDEARSLKDEHGTIVQPYGRFDRRRPAAPGQERVYRVELWPIGNRFKAGHRIRVHVLGTSIASMPMLPAVNTVDVAASRLLLPVLPGSDLRRALGE
ncbi:CocE/NonD family hydrolase [Patulibacter defluvii]|uniref:CocE/NonD family hydrolase n=1 Tax=Patulibacter defluvii TaxID=3095358 RepID=UPI002A753211|nr:CocE/NonD family hydrolase [Patulibacter sp. DM4]